MFYHSQYLSAILTLSWQGFIFELTDLYEKKNFPKVIYCIHALRFEILVLSSVVLYSSTLQSPSCPSWSCKTHW